MAIQSELENRWTERSSTSGYLIIVAIVLGLVHAGCATNPSAGSNASPTQSGASETSTTGQEVTVSGHASCVKLALEEHVDHAQIIVQGTFLSGEHHEGQLLSPAPFEADRYLKGSGDREIPVRTALHRDDETGELTRNSIGVNPTPGQSWVLFGDFDAQGVMRTSRCDGSRPVDAMQDGVPRREVDAFLEELEQLTQAGSGSDGKSGTG